MTPRDAASAHELAGDAGVLARVACAVPRGARNPRTCERQRADARAERLIQMQAAPAEPIWIWQRGRPLVETHTVWRGSEGFPATIALSYNLSRGKLFAENGFAPKAPP